MGSGIAVAVAVAVVVAVAVRVEEAVDLGLAAVSGGLEDGELAFEDKGLGGEIGRRFGGGEEGAEEAFVGGDLMEEGLGRGAEA